MWSYGVKHAGAAHAAMIQNLTPIVAMAAAWVWLGETINLVQTLGGGMIIGGLFIMRWSRRTEVSVVTLEMLVSIGKDRSSVSGPGEWGFPEDFARKSSNPEQEDTLKRSVQTHRGCVVRFGKCVQCIVSDECDARMTLQSREPQR